MKLTEPIRIRKRETFHAGAEPEYGVPPPKVKLKSVVALKRKVIAYLNNFHIGEEPEPEPVTMGSVLDGKHGQVGLGLVLIPAVIILWSVFGFL